MNIKPKNNLTTHNSHYIDCKYSLDYIKMWHRVFNNHTVNTMFTRSSFPIASAVRKLQAPRLNSLQGKCFSTSSSVVEWKEMDVVAEVTEMIDYTEFVKASISVRAFFMGTRYYIYSYYYTSSNQKCFLLVCFSVSNLISLNFTVWFFGVSVDVKRLGKKYRRNCVSYPYVVEPPDVVLRFGNTKPRTIVSLFWSFKKIWFQ